MNSRVASSFASLLANLAVAIVLVVAVVAGLAFVPGAVGDRVGDAVSAINPFDEETTDRTGPAVLLSLEKVKEFTASTGHYEVVVDKETGGGFPGFLTSQRVLYVGKGDVPATVDFSDLDADRVRVSKDRLSATVTLPTPTIGDPNLDVENSYFADTDGSLFSGDTSDLEHDAQVEAVGKIEDAAAESGQLIELAKDSTTSMLTGLLSALGFTDITIAFDDDVDAEDEPSPAE